MVVLVGAFLLMQHERIPRSLGARDAYTLLQSDSTVLVLDVRTEKEFRGPAGRLEHAILIPVESLGSRVGELSRYEGRTILVYCRSGRRSRNAVALLEKGGHTACNLEGGILEWISLGLPVIVEEEQP